MYVHADAELAIVLVDETAMEQLHVQWMDEPGPTDVLSFPVDELRPGNEDSPMPPGLLGDIVLCPQVAEVQAEAAGHSPLEELLLLTAHGLLHLLGFDHVESADEKEMFGVQRDILVVLHSRNESRPTVMSFLVLVVFAGALAVVGAVVAAALTAMSELSRAEILALADGHVLAARFRQFPAM